MTLYNPQTETLKDEPAITGRSATLSEHNSEEELIRLTSLWCEVIKVGIKDVMRGNREAIGWLHSEDFVTVCNLASLEQPELVRTAILHKRKARKAWAGA